ncbi:MAG: M6 family metalloprotease domain-containing protein [Methanobacteriota archaeon]|nr:MAG: M6 family metalloprotease domain-containing protein [Euryarchaeota archaeon]
MRTLAVLLAVAVLIPAGMVSVFPASARHAAVRSVPADADPGPSLMPPDPVSGRWPAVGIRSVPSAPLHPAEVLGLARVLVLLIQFTNVSHAPSHEAPYFDDFFNNATPAARSMRAYFREASYGGLTINATIVPTWFTSSHPMEYYGKDGTSGVDNANAPIYYLVDEAVRAADPSVDFTSFDTDHDGLIDHLVVVHAGPGQENHANLTDAIWSHSWNVYDGDPTQPGDQLLLADGVQVFRYTMISEDSPLGVMAHEFGHDLDLPDRVERRAARLEPGRVQRMVEDSARMAHADVGPRDRPGGHRDPRRRAEALRDPPVRARIRERILPPREPGADRLRCRPAGERAPHLARG